LGCPKGSLLKMEEQQTPTAGTPIYQETQEKNAKWLWLLIILVIIGVLVFAFVRKLGPFSQLNLGLKTAQVSPSPQELLSPPPESSPESQLDKSEAKIRILNGSGKAGTASSSKNFLESKGYTVESVGNADNYDFAQTVVRFKESFKKFEEVLVSDLSANYSVKVSDNSLEATDSADIEVTIGAK